MANDLNRFHSRFFMKYRVFSQQVQVTLSNVTDPMSSNNLRIYCRSSSVRFGFCLRFCQEWLRCEYAKLSVKHILRVISTGYHLTYAKFVQTISRALIPLPSRSIIKRIRHRQPEYNEEIWPARVKLSNFGIMFIIVLRSWNMETKIAVFSQTRHRRRKKWPGGSWEIAKL